MKNFWQSRAEQPGVEEGEECSAPAARHSPSLSPPPLFIVHRAAAAISSSLICTSANASLFSLSRSTYVTLLLLEQDLKP